MNLDNLMHIGFILVFTFFIMWALFIGDDLETKGITKILFVHVASILFCLGASILANNWCNANSDNIIVSEDIYRLDCKTGDWLNIESNAIVDTDKIRWKEVVAELDPGDAPIIRKVTYGNESLHGTRYVKVIEKDDDIIKMEGKLALNER